MQSLRQTEKVSVVITNADSLVFDKYPVIMSAAIYLSWFSSAPQSELSDSTLKYAGTPSFQILTFSTFVIIFPIHSTLYSINCR